MVEPGGSEFDLSAVLAALDNLTDDVKRIRDLLIERQEETRQRSDEISREIDELQQSQAATARWATELEQRIERIEQWPALEARAGNRERQETIAGGPAPEEPLRMQLGTIRIELILERPHSSAEPEDDPDAPPG
jgi:TolA-binding protein